MKPCKNPRCCAGSPHTCVMRSCRQCGVSHGFGCAYCGSCAAQLKRCEHCGDKLKQRHKKEEKASS